MPADLIKAALDSGFSAAALLDPQRDIRLYEQVRDMCAADKCHSYGKNWACPPGCGSIEECTESMRRYKTGVLVQTTCNLEDEFDYEGMMAAKQRHDEAFIKLSKKLREEYKDVLPLGAGNCQLCETCSYPEPCVAPDEATGSMEGLGMLVKDVCEACGLPYYYGKNTLTYVSCILIGGL